ncbi:hypothetical protein BVI2075_970059 [Burkholderia vietnamiensis]|nr:hypothetical protein BVI2075_970059 [Burkholderia vietnamiensis]
MDGVNQISLTAGGDFQPVDTMLDAFSKGTDICNDGHEAHLKRFRQG